MKKQERLKLIEGVDTSKMTKKEIAKIIGGGSATETVRKFIIVNRIPSLNPNQANTHHTSITKKMIVEAIEAVVQSGAILTYHLIGKQLGFTRQRAMSVVNKFGLNTYMKEVKEKTVAKHKAKSH